MDTLRDKLLDVNYRVALYGLGTETERFIKEICATTKIVGLLDSFRTSGELYGYPIISLEEAIREKVNIIVVVARPGSCKTIAKHIGDKCRRNNILLYDVRGKDLLVSTKVSYEFRHISGETRKELLQKIKRADVISFDLFDTLISRRILLNTDIFDLVDAELQRQGVLIPDFSKLRLAAEKELSREFSPRLEEIYDALLEKIGGSFVNASELAIMEERIDASTLVARTAMCDLLQFVAEEGKTIVITTDSYYSENRIREWLDRLEIRKYERILVSCEYGTSKTQKLFDRLLEQYDNLQILHIGNDDTADIEPAQARGIWTHRIYSSVDLFDSLGGLGIDRYVNTLSDRIKVGLFITRLFNDPFYFEKEENRVSISSSYDIGYLICAPIIADFILWLKQKCDNFNIQQILFCARDGFLIGRLYRKIETTRKSIYFLTSRIAAIRSGVKSVEDISYVEDMKYSGSEEECLHVRFGIDKMDVDQWENKVLQRAKKLRIHYKRYIDKLLLEKIDVGVLDFVAKGTTQFYLQRLLPQHLKGFYFLRLEPEYMEDRHLDIESFFSNEEKDDSQIYQYYYILETMLTSPYPSVEEFDEKGDPVFGTETRNTETLDYVREAQQGIEEYFEDYLYLVEKSENQLNKKLDESMLSLIDKLYISDKKFRSLVVEDSFFGRNTAVIDLI